MIARLLHGFGTRDRTIAQRCCGRRWRNLPRHRQFSHGETALTPEEYVRTLFDDYTEPALPCSEPGCRNPSSGWRYDVMGDGQTIEGESRCQEHLQP